MNVLLITNGPAYGSELPSNALRLAGSLTKREDVRIQLLEVAHRSTMEQPADWTIGADRSVTF